MSAQEAIEECLRESIDTDGDQEVYDQVAAELAQMKQDYAVCRANISDLEGQVEELRAARNEARKVIEHVLRADEANEEWDAQELVDWLEDNPEEEQS